MLKARNATKSNSTETQWSDHASCYWLCRLNTNMFAVAEQILLLAHISVMTVLSLYWRQMPLQVHAFISGQLDYCNCLIIWSNVCSQYKTLLPGYRHTTNWTHITSPEIIALAVQRVIYKMACVSTIVLPSCRWLLLVQFRQPGMLSANVNVLDIPRARTTFGDRSSAIASPRIWNNLSPSVHD